MKTEDFKVDGFLFSGISVGIKKDRKKDLGLIYSEIPARVAGLFTTNKVKAAPVLIDMERIKGGFCQALLVNSGNANACTGSRGLKDGYRISSLLSRELNVNVNHILLSSTGVIGVPLPMDKFTRGIPELVRGLSPEGWAEVVEAIMTTDTRPKMEAASCHIQGKNVKLCGMIKGAGMIRPQLATMLSFLVTDAHIESLLLHRILKEVVDLSYNRITIDGQTSTNDTVLILANGKAGHRLINRMGREAEIFKAMLLEVCQKLAHSLVRDGEGVTKVVEILIRGAKSYEEAKRAAYAVAHSPLVKTAFFGEDANWGRIICALGHSDISLSPDRVDIFFDNAHVVRNGMGMGPRQEELASKVMKKDFYKITIHLHRGRGQFSLLTTDLSLDYVKINASYRS
ncbi:MAG: bifunctional glutamate N-acetyltransferase/amino-acid acetyltransferase ArgJ [Thermodesulfobacteriota bacterium]